MSRSRVARPSTIVAACGAVVLTLALAACGSQLDPNTVAGASGGGTGAGAQAGGLTGGDTTGGVVGADPGAVTDPGTGAVAGGDAGTGSVGSTGSGAAPAGGDTGAAPAAGGTDTTTPTGKGTGKPGKPDAAAPAAATPAAACDGFKNSTGMTDTTIKIGNASDVSGPVPGLFEAAQQATKAYVAYFNATSSICGRKLELATYDSRTDNGADQQAYTQGCSETFAMVGSMSAFDSGGAATAQGCGIPDVRAIMTTQQRNACTTCFAAQSANSAQFENAPVDFLKSLGVAKAAMLYIDAGAASENGKAQAALGQKHGLPYAYVQGIPVSEFNYTPYVQKMKDLGVESVQFVAAVPQFVRLAQAMKAQGFTPKAYLLDPTGYSPDLASGGGSAVEKTYVFTNFVPFEEAASNAEVKLYLSYLQQVSPGAKPTFFGMFAWSSARLFTDQAIKLGGQLSRPTLISAMSKVDNWTDNGAHSPQHVGPKTVGDCWRIIQLNGGKWGPVGSANYNCAGVTQ